MTFLKLIANCHKWLLALITKLNKKLNNEKLASHAITNKPPHRVVYCYYFAKRLL